MSDQQVPRPERSVAGSDPETAWSSTDEPAAAASYQNPSGETRGHTGAGSNPAGAAADAARNVAEHAATEAADLKEVAVERGADVAAVAKDELAQLTSEARHRARSLWSQASEQVRAQADTGRQQVADLLHSLAGELGEMASKSTQDGPLTALAKQAAARGGEWSHWLANADSGDVLTEIRRFARRRPFLFLGGAALAGVVVGRLSRGLMAADDDTAASSSTSAQRSVPATSGVTRVPPVTLGEAPDFGSGDAPAQAAGYPAEHSSVQPLPGGEWR